MLKAELGGLMPVKPSASASMSTNAATETQAVSKPEPEPSLDDFELPGLGNTGSQMFDSVRTCSISEEAAEATSPDVSFASSTGVKRKHSEVEAEDAEIDAEGDVVVDEDQNSGDDEEPSYALVVRADGSVEQADNVK